MINTKFRIMVTLERYLRGLILPAFKKSEKNKMLTLYKVT